MEFTWKLYLPSAVKICSRHEVELSAGEIVTLWLARTKPLSSGWSSIDCSVACNKPNIFLKKAFDVPTIIELQRCVSPNNRYRNSRRSQSKNKTCSHDSCRSRGRAEHRGETDERQKHDSSPIAIIMTSSCCIACRKGHLFFWSRLCCNSRPITGSDRTLRYRNGAPLCFDFLVLLLGLFPGFVSLFLHHQRGRLHWQTMAYFVGFVEFSFTKKKRRKPLVKQIEFITRPTESF